MDILKDIHFSFRCVNTGTLTFKELQNYVEQLILENDDLPTFIYELPMCTNFSSYVHTAHPYLNRVDYYFDADQLRALYGIAHLRGRDLDKDRVGDSDDDVRITNKRALAYLKKYPEVEKKFRKQFPFIDF